MKSLRAFSFFVQQLCIKDKEIERLSSMQIYVEIRHRQKRDNKKRGSDMLDFTNIETLWKTYSYNAGKSLEKAKEIYETWDYLEVFEWLTLEKHLTSEWED